MSSILTEEPEGIEQPVADPVVDPVVDKPVEEEPKEEQPGWTQQLLAKNKENAELIKELSQFQKIDDLVSAYKEVAAAKAESEAGKVDSADAYELEDIKYPEDAGPDDDTKAWYKESAYDLGLTKEQASKLWKNYNERIASQLQEAIDADKKIRVDAAAALKKEWSNDYKLNLEITRRYLKKEFGDDLLKEIDQSGMGNSVPFIQKIFSIAKAFGEDTFVGGDTPDKESDDWLERWFPNAGIEKRAEE